MSEQWHTEENVQNAFVDALVERGWRILSAKTLRESGVDVIADLDGQKLGAEVKGYPTIGYADPRRTGEKKKAKPREQAGNWYAKAILAAMKLRGAEPDWVSIIVLPKVARYVELYGQTKGSLDAAEIEVWWIERNGDLVKESAI
ncbi:hypothetical protein [Arthrobacter sp. Cr_A7]|uniref:hypothetical protein n=1 Tax=Arthrobacter sp. Cr_A7 TaxID=3031017 RepID=UPI0023DA3EC3|nr:hypothetical protein [Arthrobacter sp. Cr_A7]MDF2048862.1 hypothetical protein [Arthrobacter sp. Cr_A7]